jgi:hypothetical protein
MGVWGKPSNPFESFAFFGSLALLVTAFIALFTPRRAAWVAIVSMVPLWIFYAPATTYSIRRVVHGRDVFELLVFLPPLLLVVASGYATNTALRGLRRKAASFAFPKTVSRRVRWSILSLAGLSILALVVICTCFVGIDREVSTPVDWAIEDEAGRSIAKFKFQRLSSFNQIETESEEVLKYLRQNKPHDLSVRVVLIYDFGKVRALRLDYAYLGDIKFRPYADRSR